MLGFVKVLAMVWLRNGNEMAEKIMVQRWSQSGQKVVQNSVTMCHQKQKRDFIDLLKSDFADIMRSFRSP